MRWGDRLCFRREQRVTEPNTKKRISLGENGPFFLTEYYDERGKLCKYSVDAEWAEDSHYELAPAQGEKLGQRLEAVYHQGSFAENLRAFFSENAHDLLLKAFMNQNGIAYVEYHFY